MDSSRRRWSEAQKRRSAIDVPNHTTPNQLEISDESDFDVLQPCTFSLLVCSVLSPWRIELMPILSMCRAWNECYPGGRQAA